MSDVKPLLACEVAPPRPLDSSLVRVPSHDTTSPWTPRPVEALPAPRRVRVPSGPLEAGGLEPGGAEGPAGTAALRTRLGTAISKLEAATADMRTLAGTQIADAVVAVVGAWTQHADRAALLAPIVRSWLDAANMPARAHVHPVDADAVREMFAGAVITVVADPEQKPGDIAIRGEALELVQRWDDRLIELREQVVMWLDNEDQR